MTGYGRARKTLSNRDITVEVRSVNNRYLDCTVKLPRAYIFAEDAIKGRVQKAISRGKVDVFISIDSTGADEEIVAVNEGLARSYLEAFDKLCALDGGKHLNAMCDVTDFARIPDVLSVTKAEEDLNPSARTSARCSTRRSLPTIRCARRKGKSSPRTSAAGLRPSKRSRAWSRSVRPKRCASTAKS